jgi:hypothetical protein
MRSRQLINREASFATAPAGMSGTFDSSNPIMWRCRCFNTFWMLNKVGTMLLSVSSTGDLGLEAVCRHGMRGDPDVHALASRNEKRVTIISWNYHDDDKPGPLASSPSSLTGVRSGRCERPH